MLKLPWPSVTCSEFGSGKTIVVGSHCVMGCLVAARFTGACMGKGIGKDVQLHSFDSKNMVGSVDTGHRVDLATVYDKSMGKAIYNKDGFSGLQLYLKNPKCAVIVASSGKFIITGIKRVFVSCALG